ncbi:hypothetical protein F7725_022150 [Dissostichus mawsoni]|uniref:Uncharacterized protein n=1 Tax=Dissostichus mawsoni TaxID=36200 RepID=A0A7J5ZF13_DISMA|nr:hypothetical protein F7725_022150 [Dissostichus mawsoni]
MVGYTPQTECAVLDEPVPNSPGRWALHRRLLDKSLIQFCYFNLVQDELDEVVHTWNSHKNQTKIN